MRAQSHGAVSSGLFAEGCFEGAFAVFGSFMSCGFFRSKFIWISVMQRLTVGNPMTSSASNLKHHHVDLDLFMQLYEDLSIFPSVASAFARMVRHLRAEVRKELDCADAKSLSASLHKMKGCCAMMGAANLAIDIGQLEVELKCSDIDGSMSHLQEVLHKIDEMEGEVGDIASDVLNNTHRSKSSRI